MGRPEWAHEIAHLSHCSLVALVVLASFSNTQAQLSLPNPEHSSSVQECNTKRAGKLCDKANMFTSAERDQIERSLDQVLANNPCGHCVAVAAINGSSNDVVINTAKKLTTDWKFPGCTSLAVLAFSLKPVKYLWFEAGQNSILCSDHDKQYERNKKYFRAGDYAIGIQKMMESLQNEIKMKYKSAQDCTKGLCAKFVNIGEIEKMLPNPYENNNRRTCNIDAPGYLCDPEEFFTRDERTRLYGKLKQVTNNACGACLSVAVLDRSTTRNSGSDFKRLLEKMTLTTWQPARECQSKTILLVAKKGSFARLAPSGSTPACSKLKALYENNVGLYKDGDWQGGVFKMVDEFEKVMGGLSKQECQQGKCAGSGLTGAGKSGAGGFGGFVGKAKNILGKVPKKLIIGLVVGIIVLVVLGLCCGFIFCREKMMKGLQGLGGLAAAQGPGLMNKFRGGGGGGGSAAYTAGGQRDEGPIGFGGTIGEQADTGGGGGNWGESGGQVAFAPSAPGAGGDEGNRGWVGSSTKTGGGGAF